MKEKTFNTNKTYHKSFQIKELGDKEGVISGIANQVNFIDSYSHMTIPGTFTKTVKENPKVYALAGHDSSKQIGISYLSETPEGSLWVDMELNLKTQVGRDQYELVKKAFEEGLNPAFSIGFTIKDALWIENDEGEEIFELKEVSVKEVSLVINPVNKRSLVENIKENKLNKNKEDNIMSKKDLKEKVSAVKEAVEEKVSTEEKVEVKAEVKEASVEEKSEKQAPVEKKEIVNNYYLSQKGEDCETKEESDEVIDTKSFELLQAKGARDFQKVNEIKTQVKALATSNLTSQTVLPTGTSGRIIDKLKERSQLFSLLEFAPTSTGSFEFAISGNYGTAGATAEAGNYVDGDEAISTVTVNASKVTTIQKVSEEALNYSPAWFANWLTNRVVSRLKSKVEDYLIDGSGSSNQPLGLFRQTAITQKVTLATRGTITLAEIEGLLDAISLDAKEGAVLIMNPKTWSHILNKKATDGHYVFRDLASYQDPTQLRLRGYRVILSEKVHAIGSASGDASKNLILFGNISNADYFGAVLGWNVSFQVLNELYAAAGQVGYKASLAFGFKVLQADGFAYLTNKN